MKKIETYGIKINLKDLRETARATTNYANGYYSPMYDEVFYDRSTGEVWSIFQCSIGHNTYTVYHDPDIIKLGDFTSHVSAQGLMDIIKEYLDLDR